MKRIRVVGLCMVALFAFGAIGAASAFAEPEFNKPVEGAAFPTHFTSVGGAVIFNTKEHI
jgi:hypothetical protein